MEDLTATSVNVSNRENSASRWSQAIDHYTRNCVAVRESRTAELCRCAAIIDISGSMEGKKLIAVKLGLCSLISGLEDRDEMNIIAFESTCRPVTDGFLPVSHLRERLPAMLEALFVDGCTACYDAILQGIRGLRTRCEDYPDPAIRKNIAIVLTDGEDNKSKFKPVHVERHLCSPGINFFMFIMVAVGMTSREERHFRSWMDLGHCKQISVSVKTGSSLVGVFKEMMLSRILQSDVSGGRFLENGERAIQEELYGESMDDANVGVFTSLRTQLLRKAPAGAEGDDCIDDNDEDDGYCSDGVSCVSSCSDPHENVSGDDDFDTDDDDDDDEEENEDSMEDDFVDAAMDLLSETQDTSCVHHSQLLAANRESSSMS